MRALHCVTLSPPSLPPSLQILGVCRTEHLHPTRISVVAQDGMGPDGRGGPGEVKAVSARFAYLIDLQTVRITDLLTANNATLATVNHDTKIDWLVRRREEGGGGRQGEGGGRRRAPG